MTALNRADARAQAGAASSSTACRSRAATTLELRLHKDQRKVDRLRRLNEIYWPYGALDCVFDDRNARELLDQLHPDDRERFGFDVDEIDWDHYLGEVHLPALRAIAVPPAPGPKKIRSAGRRARARGPARAGGLRRRGRDPRLAPSRTSTPGCARATCPSSTSSCGRPASPPACPAGSWRTGAAAPPSTAASTASTRTCRRASCAAGQGGAAGLHPAADPERGDPPDPRAQAPRRQGDPDHRRARLPRRVAASTSATS